VEDPVTSAAAASWNTRYVEGRTAWDLGGPPPALLRVIRAVSATSARLRVLVPGAGRAHDALAWAEAGHDATAVDFAPLAVAAAREAALARGLPLTVREADIFALPDDLAGAFDVVWEQTCFCAIPPDRRPDYARAMAACLAPGGQLIGLFWAHGREGGPPFDVQRDHIQAILGARFEITAMEDVPDSPPGRSPEILAWLRRS
jgi:SAM-dependent methyltransferase